MMQSRSPAPLPPRWFVRAAWVGHRPFDSITGGRRGLRRPTAERRGMLRLRTVGRHTGEERIAILGYIEDGSTLVTKAMNGWAEAFPPSAPRSSPVVATAPDRTVPARTDVQPPGLTRAASDPVHIGTTLFSTALHSASRYEDDAPTERWREPRGSSSGTASH